MRNIVFFIAVFGVGIFCACDEDSFSRVVEIDVPMHDPKLVVNSLLDDNDTLLRVRVFQSRGILEEGGSEYIAML